MYARVSRYKMKPESFADAQRRVEAMRPQIAALPGLRAWQNVGRESDASGVVFAIYDDQAAAEAAQPAANEIWAHFSDDLAGPPDTEGYDWVLALPES